MNEFTSQAPTLHTSADARSKASAMHGAYVGLDVHKETIAIAVAEPGRQEPVYEGALQLA